MMDLFIKFALLEIILVSTRVFCQTCNNNQKCPDKLPYCAPTGECLEHCPSEVAFITNLSVCIGMGKCQPEWPEQKYCSESCPEDNYVYKSVCVSKCPDNASYSLNGQCVETCPLYSMNSTCMEKCPNDLKFIYKKSCYRVCPTDTCLMDNGINCTDQCYMDTISRQLVYKCPKNAPYMRNYSPKNHCVSSCEEHEVLDMERCINVTDCKRAVLSHGKCEDECPEGYFYTSFTYDNSEYEGYHYTLDNIKDTPCQLKSATYSVLIFFGLLSSIYWLCLSKFLFSVHIKRGSCWTNDYKVQGEQRLDHQTSIKMLIQEHAGTTQTVQDILQDEERLNEEQNDDIPLLNLNSDNVENSEENSEQVCMVDIHMGNDSDSDDVPLLGQR